MARCSDSSVLPVAKDQMTAVRASASSKAMSISVVDRGRYSTWCSEPCISDLPRTARREAKHTKTAPAGVLSPPRGQGGQSPHHYRGFHGVVRERETGRRARTRTHCAACLVRRAPEHTPERNPRTTCSTIPAVAVSTKLEPPPAQPSAARGVVPEGAPPDPFSRLA